MFPPISAVSVSNSTGFVVGFGFSFEHGSTTKFSLNFDHFKNKITLKLVENVGGFGPDFGTVALPLSWLSIAQLFNWKYFKLSAIVLSFFHTFQTPFSRILFGKWCHEMKKKKNKQKKNSSFIFQFHSINGESLDHFLADFCPIFGAFWLRFLWFEMTRLFDFISIELIENLGPISWHFDSFQSTKWRLFQFAVQFSHFFQFVVDFATDFQRFNC